MKKHIYAVTIMAILAGIYHFGCTSAAKEHDTTTTMQSTKFDGAQGDCTNGGVKIEVLVDGVVDETQTQYLCNGTQGQDGQGGTSTNIKTTKFDGAQGDCTHGGVKIDLLLRQHMIQLQGGDHAHLCPQPAKIFSIVDLPAPFRAISAMRSPSLIANEMRSNITSSP